MPYALFSNDAKLSKTYPTEADVWKHARKSGLVVDVITDEDVPATATRQASLATATHQDVVCAAARGRERVGHLAAEQEGRDGHRYSLVGQHLDGVISPLAVDQDVAGRRERAEIRAERARPRAHLDVDDVHTATAGNTNHHPA